MAFRSRTRRNQNDAKCNGTGLQRRSTMFSVGYLKLVCSEGSIRCCLTDHYTACVYMFVYMCSFQLLSEYTAHSLLHEEMNARQPLQSFVPLLLIYFYSIAQEWFYVEYLLIHKNTNSCISSFFNCIVTKLIKKLLKKMGIKQFWRNARLWCFCVVLQPLSLFLVMKNCNINTQRQLILGGTRCLF